MQALKITPVRPRIKGGNYVLLKVSWDGDRIPVLGIVLALLRVRALRKEGRDKC